MHASLHILVDEGTQALLKKRESNSFDRQDDANFITNTQTKRIFSNYEPQEHKTRGLMATDLELYSV